MKVDERVDDPRSRKKRVLLGTGSEWTVGAHVHQEDVCGAAPMRRAEMEVARGPRGDREAVLTA